MLSGLVVCLAAVAQGVTGMGFGLICAPLLIGLYGPAEGVRLVVLLALILNASYLAQGLRSVLPREALSLLLPALIAAPLLSSLARSQNPQRLLVTAGLWTVLSATLLASGVQFPWLRGPLGAAGAGAVSAAMNVVGGLAGPAVAMYAVNAAWPTPNVRPTLQLYGLGLNVVTLLSLGLPRWHAAPALGLAAGLMLGLLSLDRLPQHATRRLILGLAASGGVLIFLRGLA